MQQNNEITFHNIFIGNKTKQQIVNLQSNAIRHIQQLNAEIQSIMKQIQQQSPYKSNIQSPIDKHQQKSNVKLKLFNQIKSTHQKQKEKELAYKKMSISGIRPNKSNHTIHFTSYMKSTKHVSERFVQQLKKQNELKEIEKQRQMQKLRIVKQKTMKHYNDVKSRYTEYEDRRKMKEALEIHAMKQKQAKEKDGVTFLPKTNKNIGIKETFQQRLKDSQIRRQTKEAKIIKQMIKNDTFRPKINSNKLSESKIKMYWSRNKISQTNQSIVSEQVEQNHQENELKIDANQLNFVLDKDF